jgi:hypothetical protein
MDQPMLAAVVVVGVEEIQVQLQAVRVVVVLVAEH